MFKNMMEFMVMAAIALTAMFGLTACGEQHEATNYDMDCVVTELNASEHEFTVERVDGHIFDCVLFDGYTPMVGDVLTITFDDAGTDKVTDDVPMFAIYKQQVGRVSGLCGRNYITTQTRKQEEN